MIKQFKLLSRVWVFLMDVVVDLYDNGRNSLLPKWVLDQDRNDDVDSTVIISTKDRRGSSHHCPKKPPVHHVVIVYFDEVVEINLTFLECVLKKLVLGIAQKLGRFCD